MGCRSTIVVLACAGVLAAATTAAADDASVEGAWMAKDAQYQRLGVRFARESERWKRSGLTRVEGLLRVSRATRRLLRHTRAEVARQQPSSATGGRAQRLVLRSIGTFRRSFRLLERGLRLGVRSLRMSRAGRDGAGPLARRADLMLRRSDRTYRRGYRQATRAQRFFRVAEHERDGATPVTDPAPQPAPPAPPAPCLLAPLICPS